MYNTYMLHILYIHDMFVLNIILMYGTRDDYTLFLEDCINSACQSECFGSKLHFPGSLGHQVCGKTVLDSIDGSHPNRSKKLNSLRPSGFMKQKIYPIYQHLKLFCLLWTNFLPHLRHLLRIICNVDSVPDFSLFCIMSQGPNLVDVANVYCVGPRCSHFATGS